MEQIKFKLARNPLFRVVTAQAVPAGAGHVVPAADPALPEVPDTGGLMVYNPDILLVTRGLLRADVAGATGPIDLAAGDGTWDTRYKAPHLITAELADTGFVCLTPHDGTVWRREIVHVPKAAAVGVPPENGPHALFVATGGIDIGGEPHGVNALVPVGPTQPTSMTGVLDSYVIRVWR